MRTAFAVTAVLVAVLLFLGGLYEPYIWFGFIFVGPIVIVGFYDYFQTKRTILRNFPILGHFRYWFEMIRPEINQYFIESNTDGVPLSREQRSIVYQRAKKELDTLPFGTQRQVYEPGYEWISHSLAPTHVDPDSLRIVIGGPDCQQPYSASILNVSAMSFGALSSAAIEALNAGAKLGNFAHNTGEGGISKYHLRPGGDLIWQIGTAYFGTRTLDGAFCEKQFKEKSNLPQVKMIEIKLSQGAKPAHGGILPAQKVTKEIGEIRHVRLGFDVISPPAHSTFSTPVGLLEFVQRLRELSSGKPIGIKLCIGKRREFLSICKAMVKTGIAPDFITVDGGEGGTGAAPPEFSNTVGCPLVEGLILVHNALLGFSLRHRIKIIVAGKVITGFDLVKRMALGADLCSAARSMMLALGCIQALRCNSNQCPTGVATQKRDLVAGLVVNDKKHRVASYHRETIESVAELLGAMAIEHPDHLRPWHILRRTEANQMKNYSELHPFLNDGDLLKKELPETFKRAVETASPESFHQV